MPAPNLPATSSTCLLGIRKRLVDTGLYLGDMSLRDSIHWVWDGWADKLAIKVAEPKDSVVGNSLLSPPPDDGSFDLAPISAVVQINTNDYGLTVDANYRGPMDIWPDYAIIKPSCVFQVPDAVPFIGDWGMVTDNLCWLQECITTPTFSVKQGLFTTAVAGSPQFKMHHILFEV